MLEYEAVKVESELDLLAVFILIEFIMIQDNRKLLGFSISRTGSNSD